MKKAYKTIGIFTFFIIGLTILILAFIFGGEGTLKKNDMESIFVENDVVPEIKTEEKLIVVEIKGEVKNPNVFRLKEGSIIDDLILMAGGLTDKADLSTINRAEKLQNNKCIVVYNKEEVKEEVVKNQEKATESIVQKSGLININTASLAELDTLPGIGPKIAEYIIMYREETGGFKNIEELMNIDRIGSKSFEKIKGKIEV